jgi:hypothetical protein
MNDDTLFLEPRGIYDAAILRCVDGVLVYSADQIITLLIEHFRPYYDGDEETLEDQALNHFHFNIEPDHRGPFTPVYEWEIREDE